jgi:hypothetical protein
MRMNIVPYNPCMGLYARGISWLAVILAITTGGVGLFVSGVEIAVLWALMGYFLGKIIQSTIWTVAGDTRQ